MKLTYIAAFLMVLDRIRPTIPDTEFKILKCDHIGMSIAFRDGRHLIATCANEGRIVVKRPKDYFGIGRFGEWYGFTEENFKSAIEFILEPEVS